MKPTSRMIGAAGEYFIVSRLLRRGYIAALAPDGAPNTDVVVTNTLGTRLCTIQVKTRTGGGKNRSWRLSEKHEHITGARLFYSFVDLGVDERDVPIVYILPSKKVADLARDSHRAWLSQPGRNGKTRNDSKMRALWADYSFIFGAGSGYDYGWLDHYKENWSLLELA